MRKKNLLLILVWMAVLPGLQAQELNAKITVLANRVPNSVDHKIFQTLQSSLYNFLNNRKWSNETFQTSEKITCNFLLNISSAGDNNTFQASLTVQAGRPVYNSSYQSPLINFNDEAFTFRYVEYQPLDFNENRVQGSEPYAANLTAEFAYYVYIILGLNFDSYALRGGDPYFQKALNIVNNAPDSRDISGWKPFDGVRNRYDRNDYSRGFGYRSGWTYNSRWTPYGWGYNDPATRRWVIRYYGSLNDRNWRRAQADFYRFADRNRDGIIERWEYDRAIRNAYGFRR